MNKQKYDPPKKSVFGQFLRTATVKPTIQISKVAENKKDPRYGSHYLSLI